MWKKIKGVNINNNKYNVNIYQFNIGKRHLLEKKNMSTKKIKNETTKWYD